MRSWQVPQTPPYNYWYWSDDGSPFMSAVNYGYSGSGTTWDLPAALSYATLYTLIIHTFNNENWNIDVTTLNFTTP